MTLFFPRFIDEEDNKYFFDEIIQDELKEVLHKFQKDKIMGLDGWIVQFYTSFFDLIGKDLLAMVEESHMVGHIHAPLNKTFIALIPKSDNPQTFDDFIPISLCRYIYKVVENIIAKRIKFILLYSISKEKFGFSNGRQIHESIEVAQEGLHSLKISKEKGNMLKIDLSKVYDCLNWSYLRLLLTHLGFEVPFLQWVMACILLV
jgi:hypothetical protein